MWHTSQSYGASLVIWDHTEKIKKTLHYQVFRQMVAPNTYTFSNACCRYSRCSGRGCGCRDCQAILLSSHSRRLLLFLPSFFDRHLGKLFLRFTSPVCQRIEKPEANCSSGLRHGKIINTQPTHTYNVEPNSSVVNFAQPPTCSSLYIKIRAVERLIFLIALIAQLIIKN